MYSRSDSVSYAVSGVGLSSTPFVRYLCWLWSWGIAQPKGKMSENRQIIYIIDDDESVRRALRRLIRSAGWDAETFANAEDFLQSANLRNPACLILDVHLPGLSGLQLQARLHAEDRIVPLVFISAYADEQMREAALRAGAIAFLEKPFEEQPLLDAVRFALL
jgi:FixJ family two-component response regulator